MRGVGVDPGFDIRDDPVEEDGPLPTENPETSRTNQPTRRSRGDRPSSRSKDQTLIKRTSLLDTTCKETTITGFGKKTQRSGRGMTGEGPLGAGNAPDRRNHPSANSRCGDVRVQ